MIILLTAIICVFISLYLFLQPAYPHIEEYLKFWHKRRTEKITPKLEKIFIDLPYKKLLLIDILSPLFSGLLAYLLTKTSWVALIAAVAGLVIPNIVLVRLEAIRRRKFTDQLVDGLMLLSGSLKAGLSLLQAFEALIEEMPAPISQEFSLVVRQNRMGIPLEECLAKLKERMSCEELNMTITAILVARETGGDLTAIFSNLVINIRERSRILGKVRALCTQSKLQGNIMMLLPIVFTYSVYKLDPNFLSVLMNDEQGRMLLMYAVVSEIIGIFLISRMSKVNI